MAAAYQSNFIFGYGSLVNVKNLEQYLKRELKPNSDYTICNLKNFQRCWNVAMDNQIDLPKYKYYRNRNTKERLDSFVTFLNIRRDPNQTISGILFRISDTELENLDLRERNYNRIEITDQLSIKVQGNAWTYIGLQEAEQRYQKGLSKGNAMISRSYFNSVHNAYFLLGSEEYANYIATTDKPTVPIVNLEVCKVNIPLISDSEIKE